MKQFTFDINFAGFETARSLALHGAHVVMMCRSSESGKEAVRRITKERPQAAVEFIACDLCNLSSVYHCAQSYIEKKWYA